MRYLQGPETGFGFRDSWRQLLHSQERTNETERISFHLTSSVTFQLCIAISKGDIRSIAAICWTTVTAWTKDNIERTNKKTRKFNFFFLSLFYRETIEQRDYNELAGASWSGGARKLRKCKTESVAFYRGILWSIKTKVHQIV